MRWSAVALAASLACGLAGASATRGAQEEAVTLWVLPLENPARDRELDDLARAVTDLLSITLARAEECALVERERLDAVLSEQSLALAGLADPGTRRRVGGLLGARWVLHGSLARHAERLWIAAHVTEVESTRILASEQFEAEPAELAARLDELAAGLVRALRARAGVVVETHTVAPAELDPTPAASLRFLRGLGHYYSGLPHRALAEFLHAGCEAGLADSAAVWRANCYLALRESGHAFLELARLRRRGTGALDPAALDERIERCRRMLSPEELRLCELLLPRER